MQADAAQLADTAQQRPHQRTGRCIPEADALAAIQRGDGGDELPSIGCPGEVIDGWRSRYLVPKAGDHTTFPRVHHRDCLVDIRQGDETGRAASESSRSTTRSNATSDAGRDGAHRGAIQRTDQP